MIQLQNATSHPGHATHVARTSHEGLLDPDFHLIGGDIDHNVENLKRERVPPMNQKDVLPHDP